MTDPIKPDNTTRRDFLQLGWALGVGALVPFAMSGCSSGSDNDNSTPIPETFVDPPLLKSVNGLLDVTLTMSYTNKILNGKNVTLRSFNQRIPAPTFSVNIGDTLRVRVVNMLPPNPPSTDPVHLRFQNSANLHTHGVHVTPGLVSPGIYGDFVMDDPSLGIEPGTTRQHEFRIGLDHPDGAYWYHPHLHGSTAVQVGSGMAGALKISGNVDKVPEIAAAKERFFMFQAPITDANGVLESFGDTILNEPPFLINGVRRPTLIMRSGEVQNWHFINASIISFLNLNLDGHTLNVYSHDGNCRGSNIQLIPPDTQKGLVMAPGNRDSVLVKAGSPGTYYLRTLQYNMGFNLNEDIVATVIVLPETRLMSLPTRPLPVSHILTPISDTEFAQHGGLKRDVVLREIFNKDGSPVTNPPASTLIDPGPGELADWIYEKGNTFLATTVFAMGTASETASTDPALPTIYYPFQAHAAPKQTIALNSVEEWTIYNMDNIQHPFHIHVNPFWVTKINGVPLEHPYWADTIGLPLGGTPENPASITFRTRFLDFTGTYVMHCHILVHEDMGMMQAVEVV